MVDVTNPCDAGLVFRCASTLPIYSPSSPRDFWILCAIANQGSVVVSFKMGLKPRHPSLVHFERHMTYLKLCTPIWLVSRV